MNKNKNIDLTKILPVLAIAVLGISSVVFHQTMESCLIHIKMLLLAFAQNISFSIISRARNRNSHNYHLLAAVCSNGVWFLTFQHLVLNQMSVSMVLPFITGTTLGSLLGAYISREIEQILGLSADATKDEIKKGGAENSYYFKNYALFIILGVIGILSIILSKDPRLVAVILSLAYINHVTAGLSGRAKNRGSHKYLTITTAFSAAVWFFTFGFLIKNNMSMALFIPYTVATVFGSITGARVSMAIEKAFGFKPDEHKQISTEFKSLSSFIHSWYLLFVIVASCLFLAMYQETTFLILIIGIAVYGSQSMTYVISSRASNRNNMTYHLCARLVNGTITFLSYKYFVDAKASPDIFAPVLLGQTLGNIFGQKTGIKIETRIGAVMDSEEKKK